MATNIKLYDVPYISSLQDMVIKSSQKYHQKLALEDLTNSPISKVSYLQLLENILRFGTALQQLGIKERTHVALIGENRVQWGIAYLTLMSFDYVVVPIDKNLTSNEILNIIHESDAEAIIFSDTYQQLLSEKKDVLKRLKHFIAMDLQKKNDSFLSMFEMISTTQPVNVNQLPKINPDETAEIIFTSGSLGRAKGVMLSQSNLVANLMSMTKMLFIYPEDKFLSVLPIHHTYECTCGFLCPIFSGASVHFARSLKTVSEDIQKVHATMLLGVPLLFEKMFRAIYKAIEKDKVKSVIMKPLISITDFAEKAGWKNSKKKIFHELHQKFGGSVRLFIAGGAAPDPKVSKGLREFGFNFVQGYGLTETSPILALNQLDNFKDNAAGLPLPGVQIKINGPDEEGVGEIFAKGPSIMLGYYKNEKITNEAFENGWFKTGDLGCFDEDGFLHISGRKKNVIIANNGKNIFPEEIEDILHRSPYVLESLVFGEKDEKHDERIAAQIFVNAEAFIDYSEKNNVPITEELIHQKISEVIKQTNEQLSSFKQIKKFYIRQQEFEKTTTQKIKRYAASNSEA
ncbi:MAG: AMP-binding protein [Ignavibacteriaceae bacterium]|jgi:long-chain acyl-CoA synthetase|nr:AMP-binding protein [Ignavibacteriaceae bacterium]